ncbi:MAG TPA: amidase domain-containing protein [Symbiobacteriaceae bacterium]|nr:amidase domain-containing protein [Symbiobacteriaceae bacterium]
MKRYRWIMVGALVLFVSLGGALSRAAPDPGVKRFLEEMYAARSQALVTGRSAAGLDNFYDLSAQSGRFALAHEVGRIGYMQAWAPARQLKISDAGTTVTNLRVTLSGDTARVSLIARTRLTYLYDGSTAQNQMGIGSWHWLELQQKDGGWKVAREFYLDALGDEWTEPYVPPDGSRPSISGNPAPEPEPAARGKFDRQGAVTYAETYCGAAWGCGNNSDYNERFRSYRNLGGDCANFASQVLTQGGKLKPDWVWKHNKEGSTCWVNAQAFVRYLSNSGRARLLAKGSYAQVAPALGKLKPGDIIGYQEKGSITHVSVVTGADSSGTPVVAAHTADRFRNPWDLGWGKESTFWLLHLRD